MRRTDGDGHGECEWVVGTVPGGGEVAGDGAALLAWASGRAWALRPGELTVSGDAMAAAGLPGRLTYG